MAPGSVARILLSAAPPRYSPAPHGRLDEMKVAPGSVFVVGAGASVAYKLPTGAMLRDEIVQLAVGRPNGEMAKDVLVAANALPGDLEAMGRAVNNASVGSIDEWVGLNPNWGTLAKCAIAAILLHREATEPVLPGRTQFHLNPDWIGYFLRHAFASEGGLDGVKIVTFNFDRIIEARLDLAIAGRYGLNPVKSPDIPQLEILHVSGILGQPEWSPKATVENTVRFGVKPDAGSIRIAGSQIYFVHEERAEETLSRAREMIKHAPLVAFVGFGFHPQNVEPLGVRHAAQNAIFIGSAHGMDTAEARGIEHHFKRVLRLYDRCDALAFLRHAPNLHRKKLPQPMPLDWEDYTKAPGDLIARRNRRPSE